MTRPLALDMSQAAPVMVVSALLPKAALLQGLLTLVPHAKAQVLAALMVQPKLVPAAHLMPWTMQVSLVHLCFTAATNNSCSTTNLMLICSSSSISSMG